MPIYWVVLILIGIGTGLTGLINQRTDANSAEVDASAVAQNLLVYRNALAEYAHANKSASGPVPDSSLGLPSWYFHLPGINGYVQAGSSFSYFPSPPEGLVAELVRLTDSSLAVGLVKAGQVISPAAGATGIAVPSAIPDGAAIAFQ